MHSQDAPPVAREKRRWALMATLVTGVAGFIGFHTAKRLLERGDSVIGFDVVNNY